MGTGPQASQKKTIEEWLEQRPSWLRAAAQQLLVSRGAISEGDIEDLATYCVEEASDRFTVPHPPIPPGTIQAAVTGPDLRIENVSEIRGVNALGKTCELSFSEGDITVVYGANGSGKSGYTRLLKHMCGARASETMYGNVFQAEDEVAAASVRLSYSSRSTSSPTPKLVDVEWSANGGPSQKLRSIQIFDAATANMLGHGSNAASHLPQGMRFIGALIDASDRVSANLKQREEQLIDQLPPLPIEYVSTATGTFLKQLSARVPPQAIDDACEFTDLQRNERIALEAALTQADPSTSFGKLVQEIDRLTMLGAEMEARVVSLDDDTAMRIVGARRDAATKRGAAQEYATKFFEGMPLAGVGEQTWRRMWSAATQFSQAHAYPGHPYPNCDDGAHCVLCQQLLGADAKVRMKNFSEYISDRLEADAAGSELQLSGLMTALPSTLTPDNWKALGASFSLSADDEIQLCEQYGRRIAALKEAVAIDEIPIIVWGPWRAAVANKIAQLSTEKNALVSLIDPAARQQIGAQLRELQAREWLARHRAHVVEEVERAKQRLAIAAALRLTNTSSLTNKSNEIGEEELANGFCERFNAELKRLGGGVVPVEMTHRSEGKGKFTFLVQLRGTKQDATCRNILSEGEQRVVALAAFLADVTGSERSLPIIFDDPISSLDQRFEETVSQRLVELAETHQVILFTHRLSLMVLISSITDSRSVQSLAPVKIAIASISRHGSETGAFASINVFSMAPKAGLNTLKDKIARVKKVDIEFQNTVIKDACSNFRILVERAVEDHLCSKVIVRFRREIKTMNLLKKLTVIDSSDVAIIDGMMTKYSAYEHSQSMETPTWLPAPDELMADIDEMLKWIADFDRRAKAVA